MESNIYIRGEIGVDYTYSHALADYQRSPGIINLYVDSPGGDLKEGKEIRKLFEESGRIGKSYNLGDVASIAVNIFMAAKKENRYFDPSKGRMLIHYPWGEGVGTADEMLEYSKELKSEEGLLVKELSSDLGVEETILRGYMKQDRYLSEEEIGLLGIANIVKREFKAIAKLNKNMTDKEVKEELSGIKKAIEGIKSFFKPKAITLQDVNGAQIDIPEIETEDQLAPGANVTVDGSPGMGEYVLPDGRILVCDSGKLIEIKSGDDELEALRLEAENLRAENELLKQSVQEKDSVLNSVNEKVLAVEKEFKTFKSKYSKENIPPSSPSEEGGVVSRKPFKNR